MYNFQTPFLFAAYGDQLFSLVEYFIPFTLPEGKIYSGN